MKIRQSLKIRQSHVACALLGILAMPVEAVTLALFTNDASNGTDLTYADEAGASNVTVSSIAYNYAPNGPRTGDGVNGSTTATTLEFGFPTGHGIRDLDDDPSSMSSSDATDRFATFSIEADAGYEIQLNTSDIFSYVIGANTFNQYDVKTYSLAYISDQSDFSNILVSSSIGTIEDTLDSSSRYLIQENTLNPDAGAVGSYQKLYFAIEIATENTNDANKRFNIGEVSFDSSLVLVPEPTSTALLGLGGLALILRRRK